MTDYNNKCGTCAYFERNGSTKRGWCHKRKYGEDVACDPSHPYPEYSMSRLKCHCYDKRKIDELRGDDGT